jgi:hypothetical protein
VRKGHLRNASQALVVRVGDDVQDKRMIKGNEPVNRVIDDFSLPADHASIYVVGNSSPKLQNYNMYLCFIGSLIIVYGFRKNFMGG